MVLAAGVTYGGLEVSAHCGDGASLGEFYERVYLDVALVSEPKVVGLLIEGRVLERRMVGVVRCLWGSVLWDMVVGRDAVASGRRRGTPCCKALHGSLSAAQESAWGTVGLQCSWEDG